MTHLTLAICYVLYVQRVTRLPLSSTEKCITGAIWSLDSDNEAVDVEYHLVMISVLSVLWILKWYSHLLQLIICWKFSEPAFIHTHNQSIFVLLSH